MARNKKVVNPSIPSGLSREIFSADSADPPAHTYRFPSRGKEGGDGMGKMTEGSRAPRPER